MLNGNSGSAHLIKFDLLFISQGLEALESIKKNLWETQIHFPSYLVLFNLIFFASLARVSKQNSIKMKITAT